MHEGVLQPQPGLLRVKRVCHVSADFPDPVEPFKTPVIKTLLELTHDRFDHEVISLNRRMPAASQFLLGTLKGCGKPALPITTTPFEAGIAVEYGAPARGLFHATMLHALGDWLTQTLRSAQLPDLLTGHKLTVEGIVVRRAAQALDIPYAISIQGDTDTKILSARPDLRRELAKVFHGAAMVFPFTPWALRKVEMVLGKRQGPIRFLPCPTELDTPLAPRRGGNGFVSVFHLKNYRRKNLATIAAAQQLLATRAKSTEVTIFGGGSDEQRAACKRLIESTPRMQLGGPLERDALQDRLNRATGFVMPSLRESFGLVFVEALFAGLPVIYPAGQAIDGYFEDLPFAIPVESNDAAGLADAMARLMREEMPIKAALAAWQQSPQALQFTRAAIGREFAMGLSVAAGLKV